MRIVLLMVPVCRVQTIEVDSLFQPARWLHDITVVTVRRSQ